MLLTCSEACWDMALLWKGVRCALMPQCKSRQEQKEWQLSRPSFCILENESENLQVFITKCAADSMKNKWLLPINGIDCWKYPYLLLKSFLTFDFFFSLSFLPVQSSSPLQRWQTWCRKLSLTSWSTGLMGGEICCPFHAFSSPCITNL